MDDFHCSYSVGPNLSFFHFIKISHCVSESCSQKEIHIFFFDVPNLQPQLFGIVHHLNAHRMDLIVNVS